MIEQFFINVSEGFIILCKGLFIYLLFVGAANLVRGYKRYGRNSKHYHIEKYYEYENEAK